MKRICLAGALLLCALTVQAQRVKTAELEEYAKSQYGTKWTEAAANLAEQIALDRSGGLTFVQVVPAPGRTKEELYVQLNHWFATYFNHPHERIELSDKELGTIIAQGYMPDIARHQGGMNAYSVSIRPVLKCEIKEGKVRLTYTIPYYTALRVVGGGWLVDDHKHPPVALDEEWPLTGCYPFASAKDAHKKASSKALIMAFAYSRMLLAQVEDCLRYGQVGNEGDDW